MTAFLPSVVFAAKDFNIKNNTQNYFHVEGATGNIGIATITPQAGLISINNVGIGTWTAAGGNLIVNGGGNVGVGTAWPGQALDVYGTVRATAFSGDGAGLTNLPPSGWTLGASNVGISTSNNVGIGTNMTTTAGLTVMNGNVGIGTWVPAYLLQVGKLGQGNMLIGSQLSFGGNLDTISNSGNSGYFDIQSGYQGTRISGANGLTVLNNGRVGIGTTTPAGALTVMNGNLGIGTWVPGYALDIRGGLGIGTASSGASLSVGTNGNIGVGITSPTALLHLKTLSESGDLFKVNGDSLTGVTIGVDSLSANHQVGKINLNGSTDISGDRGIGGRITANSSKDIYQINDAILQFNVTASSGNASTGNLYTFNENDSAHMVISASGNVGISTATPQADLAVQGNVGIGTWTADGGNLIVNGGGNVGIGSAWPGQALDVNGTVRATAFSGDGSSLTNLPASGWTLGASNVGISTTNNVGIGSTSTHAMFEIVGNGANEMLRFNDSGINDTTPFVVLSSGNVGIGTIRARSPLEIVGALRFTNSAAGNLTGHSVEISSDLSNRLVIPDIKFATGNTSTIYNSNSDATYYSLNNYKHAGQTWITGNSSQDGFLFQQFVEWNPSLAGGYVTNFSKYDAALNSSAAVTFRGHRIEVTDNSSAIANTVNGLSVVLDGTNTSALRIAASFEGGNVGIGTTSPVNLLNVVSSGSSASITTQNANTNFFDLGVQGSTVASLDSNADIVFRNKTYANRGTATYASELLRITSAGNVGIGTTTPQGGLVVTNGNVGIGTWIVDGGSLIVNGGGNVGIATTLPGTKLDVVGTVRATAFSGDGSALTGLTPGGWTLGASNVGISTTNNVGIGTTTPQGALVVTNGNVGIGTWAPGYMLELIGSPGNKAMHIKSAGANTLIRVEANDSITNYLDIFAGSSTAGINGIFSYGSNPLAFSSGGSEIVRFLTNGNVGIGTIAPVSKLSVSGGIGVGTGLNSNFVSTAAPIGGMIVQGNVGLGSLAPGTALDVNGTVRATAFSGDGSSLTNLPASGWTLGASNVGISTTNNVGIGTNMTTAAGLSVMNGKVGIGTWAPTGTFEVAGTTQISGTNVRNALVVVGTNGTVGGSFFVNTPGLALNYGGGLGIDGSYTGSNHNSIVNIKAYGPYSGGYTSSLAFSTGGAGLTTEAMRINSSGNLGIGTTDSLGKLIVWGGNLGIGTFAPNNKLTIVGGVGIGTGINSPYVATAAPSGGLIVQGNVGLGTLAPGTALDVSGTVRATAFSGDGSALTNLPASGGWTLGASNVGISTTNNVGIGTSLTTAAGLTVMNGNVGIGTWVPQYDLDMRGSLGIGTLVSGGSVVVSSTGNVGIGNTSPPQKLSINGAGVVRAAVSSSNNQVALQLNGTFGQIENTAGDLYLTANTGNLIFRPNLSEAMRILTTGNVGIATTLPGTALDVNGTVRATAFSGDGSALTGLSAAGGFTDDGAMVHLTTETDNVGIGTTDASQGKLVVTGGNVGIGTTTPQGAFVVNNGNVGIGTISPASSLIVMGNVGIGTPVSAYPITIEGESTGGYRTGLYINPTANTYGPTLTGYTSRDSVKRIFFSGNLMAADDQSIYFGSSANFSFAYGLAAGLFRIADSSGNSFFSLLDQGSKSDLKINNGDFVVSAGGNVGIGTISPSLRLGLVGNLGIGTIRYSPFVTTGIASGHMVVEGNVGIGTVSTQEKLIVLGGNVGLGTWTASNARLETDGFRLMNNGAAAGSVLVSSSTGVGTWMPATTLPVGASGWSTGTGTVYNATGSDKVGIGTSTPQGGLVVTNGNVGIGTWVPLSALDVAGVGSPVSDLRVSRRGTPTTYLGISAPGGSFTTSAFTVQSSGVMGLQVNGGATIGSSWGNGSYKAPTNGLAVQGNLGIGTFDTFNELSVVGGVGIGTGINSPFVTTSLPTGGMIIEGNVGIATTLPGTALDVNGTVRATAFSGDGSGLTGLSAAGGFTDDGTMVHLTTSTDNVGIGTTDASIGKLIVVGGNVGIGTVNPNAPLNIGATDLGSIGESIGITKVGSPRIYFNGDGSEFLTTTAGIQFNGSNNYYFGIGSNLTSAAITIQANNTVLIPNIQFGYIAPIGGSTADTFGRTEGNKGAIKFGTDNEDMLKIYDQTAHTFLSTLRILSAGTSYPALIVQGKAAQTSDLQQWTNSSDTVLTHVSTAGNVGIGTITSLGGNLIVKGGGNVGINTSWPGALLAINGVGINTTTPLVTVKGQANLVGDYLNISNSSGTNLFAINRWGNFYGYVGGYFTGVAANAPNAGAVVVSQSSGHGMVLINGTSFEALRVTDTASSHSRLSISSKGNLGIGTYDHVVNQLVVNGGVGIGTSLSSYITTRAPAGGMIIEGNVGIATTLPGTALDVNGTVRATAFSGDGSGLTGLPSTSGWTLGASNVGISTTNNVGIGTSTPQGGLVITNGNVGIGTWTATNSLDVKGSVGIGTSFLGNLTANNIGLVVQGNVGVGTFRPEAQMVVVQSSSSVVPLVVRGAYNSGTDLQQWNYPGLGTLVQITSLGHLMLQGGAIYSPYHYVWDSGNSNAIKLIGTSRSIEFSTPGTSTTDIRLIQTSPGMLTVDDGASGAGYLGVLGNIGVGTGVMSNRLSVVGNMGIGTGKSSEYLYTAAPTGGAIIEGNVGIGTTTPQNKLIVMGNVGIGTWTAESALQVKGSMGVSVVSKSADYTATGNDYVILVDASGGAITIALPAASTVNGRVYYIKKTDASGNAVTIDPNAAETVDGSTTLSTTTQYQAFTVVCDGTQWWVI